MKEAILNVAAGKLNPIDFMPNAGDFLVNLDPMYYKYDDPSRIEDTYDRWVKQEDESIIKYCNEKAFTFLERTRIQFDRISCYRFLEHITKTEVLYFLYLVSTALKIGGTIDIIVPNYDELADMLLHEVPGSENWEAHDTTLTYEMLNEPSCPHASIWTVGRIRYFLRLEERFKVEVLEPAFDFDGRDCYIRCIAQRVK